MLDHRRAHYERQWLLKGKSKRTVVVSERIKRSYDLLAKFCAVPGKKACDLGCGEGLFAEVLEESGAYVDAVDISQNALKLLPVGIRTFQDCVPKTRLEDDAYDIVAALDLIAELPSNEHRLFFMEAARLVKSEGWVLVSTPIDFRSENALDLFLDLAKTELDLKGATLSYNLFLIRLTDLLKMPGRFKKSSLDPGYRHSQLEKRSGLAKWWFSLNSKNGTLWGLIAKMSDCLVQWIENSPKVQHVLEKLSRALKGEQGLTHAIVIGKRRPLFVGSELEEEPIPMKMKKRIWE